MKCFKRIISSFFVTGLALMVCFSFSSFADTYMSYSTSDMPLSIFDGDEYDVIQAYEINDKEDYYICAEELENYGFTITWNPKQRCTHIEYTGTRSDTLKTIPILPQGKIYKSDIKIFINNVEMKAYNIGGYSLISLTDFNRVHNLLFHGTMPSKWATNYVLDASYNGIFNFFYESLDFNIDGFHGVYEHKPSTNYQKNITVSEFNDLLNAFLNLYCKRSSDLNSIYDLPIQQNLLFKGTSLDSHALEEEITRENASVMMINALQYVAAPLETATDHFEQFNKEDFNVSTLEPSKLACENGVFTLDTNGLFHPKSRVTLEQTLVLLSKLGYKYGIFAKHPEYNLQNVREVQTFQESTLLKNTYLLNDFSTPIKLPSIEKETIDRYICNVNVTEDSIMIDSTAPFYWVKYLQSDFSTFGEVEFYSNGEVCLNAIMYTITDYLGHGIIRYEIPLPVDKDKIQNIVIKSNELGVYEVEYESLQNEAKTSFGIFSEKLLNLGINLAPQSEVLAGDPCIVADITPRIYELVDDTIFIYTSNDQTSIDRIKDYYRNVFEFENIIYMLDDQTLMIYVPIDMTSDETQKRIEIIHDVIEK